MEHESKTPWWLKALQTGLIGGVVAVLSCLIGMIESFHERDIIAGQITMGETVLLLIVITFSYFSSRGTEDTALPKRLTSGALTGLVTGGLVAGLVLLGKWVNLREILVNASPNLYKILTFEMENTTTALAYLLIAGTVIGLLTALLHLIPTVWRRAVIYGLTIVSLIALLQDLIRITLTRFPQITEALAWMFGSRGQEGLSVNGAIAVFLIVTALNYASATRGDSIRSRVRALPTGTQQGLRWGSWLLLFAFLLIWPRIAGPYLSEVTNGIGLFILMGLGLNIVVGYAGLLDLGYVAFFALGAYTMAVLTTTGGEITANFEWTFWQALPAAIFMAVLAGVVLGIPVLKIRGDYLAIITLGFGEIIRIMFLSDFLKPYFGGSFGIVLIASPTFGNLRFNTPQTLYYVILAGCLLALFVAYRLRDSRMGRAWKAIREDEDVAQAMGINLTSTKLLAFAMGAAFGGLGGAIFASKLSTVYPHSFVFLVSINVLALIIVGGMGSLPGVIVGALLLVGLPEFLREFSEFRNLIFGALLIAMMLSKPEGFLPEAVHRRELHEADNAANTAGT
ncbi:MAG: leucine/isoleucine/valine transporter permease subunit [Anaerolineae bacterium]|nr:leucine/isoleucine/valine transporter permease subunit [Anaerolineae bacterium]MCI0609214.1 leucine/isoleucine/valine transporter permease subunit [Anaerolineae bacterium]